MQRSWWLVVAWSSIAVVALGVLAGCSGDDEVQGPASSAASGGTAAPSFEVPASTTPEAAAVLDLADLGVEGDVALCVGAVLDADPSLLSSLGADPRR